MFRADSTDLMVSTRTAFSFKQLPETLKTFVWDIIEEYIQFIARRWIFIFIMLAAELKYIKSKSGFTSQFNYLSNSSGDDSVQYITIRLWTIKVNYHALV